MDSVNLVEVLATILALMFAIIGHEIMHGYVAHLYGDNTAKYAGRLSINPLVHVDMVGTIIVPAVLFFSGAPFMFGWAKPVPIFIPTVLRNGGNKAAIAVSLAGIGYNFVLAALCALLLGFFQDLHEVDTLIQYFIVYFLIQSLIYNIVLGIFNLYPIPPLDGSHALTYLADSLGWHKVVAFYDSMERYGMVILILLIATPASKYFFAPIRYVIGLLY